MMLHMGTADSAGTSISQPWYGLFCFSVYLPIGCDVRLGVYDLGGRLVSTVSENSLVSGSYTFAWDSSVPACEDMRLTVVCAD